MSAPCDSPETAAVFDALERRACGTRFVAECMRDFERQRNELFTALAGLLPFCEEDENSFPLSDAYQSAIDAARKAIARVKEAGKAS